MRVIHFYRKSLFSLKSNNFYILTIAIYRFLRNLSTYVALMILLFWVSAETPKTSNRNGSDTCVFSLYIQHRWIFLCYTCRATVKDKNAKNINRTFFKSTITLRNRITIMDDLEVLPLVLLFFCHYWHFMLVFNLLLERFVYASSRVIIFYKVRGSKDYILYKIFHIFTTIKFTL